MKPMDEAPGSRQRVCACTFRRLQTRIIAAFAPEGHPGKHLHVIATWGAFRNHSHKDGPWVEWGGGICPVNCDLVEYKVRCHPHQVFGPTPPHLLRWDHGRTPDSSLKSSDIIAYRIVNS